MDSKHEELKRIKKDCYAAIKKANEELERIRKECDHPETKKCTYAWAPGHHIEDAIICEVCGEFISSPLNAAVWGETFVSGDTKEDEEQKYIDAYDF